VLARLERRVEAAWMTRGLLAWLLYPLSLLYGLALVLRRRAAAAGRPRAENLPVPVIVVGNLIAGGAGKTPSVRAVIELLRREGWAPGVVSRGYGRRSGKVLEVLRGTPTRLCGDEPLLMHRRSGVPVFVGRDRVAAARALLQAHSRVDIIVSDDGLQHHRLARDAQLIVFDERGVGNGWLLPAGPLREPLAQHAPPRSVVLYNAPQPTTSWPGETARRGLAGAASLADWWAGAAPSPSHLDALRGRPVIAAAGVARPQRFFTMLRDRGLDIEELPLPDHHAFTDLPWPTNTADVIVTEKDAVKLGPQAPPGATRVWVATLDFQLAPATASQLLGLLPTGPRKKV
jgi:tetraacyldisaccharide 4'-kinase